MARPKKATVDYFPHMATHSKTLFLLETKWGNDGYAVWFKLLEKLASTDGHFIDCREETSIVFLSALTRVNEENLLKIIDMLAYLQAIDRGLWQQKIIFCQHFIDNIADVYQRRKVDIPTRQGVIDRTKVVIVSRNSVDVADNPQIKGNESKGDKPKKKASGLEVWYDENRERLSKLRPHADLDIEKALLLEKYGDKEVMDPAILVLNWFKKLPLNPAPVKGETQGKRRREFVL